jgi:hypothetical protein
VACHQSQWVADAGQVLDEHRHRDAVRVGGDDVVGQFRRLLRRLRHAQQHRHDEHRRQQQGQHGAATM